VSEDLLVKLPSHIVSGISLNMLTKYEN
jgi:hypothetical protein